LGPNTKLRGKISRDYKAPTLNDRYWIPGGNLALKAEKGWSEELGIDYHQDKGHFDYQYGLTIFNRNIDDWILWTRAQNQTFFSPQNIAAVWSRGIEQHYILKYMANQKTQVGLNAQYSFIKSTNQVAISSPKLEKGDQLIYTPRHQGRLTMWLRIAKGALSYTQHFSGKYQGINGNLDRYSVGDLKLTYGKEFSKLRGNFFITLQNLWNKQYQVIETRPMPGANYQAGIQIQFFK
jgi:iron complex outermembrane receptor protein